MQRQVRHRLLLIPGLLVCLALTACAPWSESVAPRASGGTLDLRAYDFEAGGYVLLRGQWEFFPGAEPFDTFEPDPATRGLLTVPGDWDAVMPPTGWSDSSHGFGVYRLKVRLPENVPELALRIKPPRSALEVRTGDRRAVIGRIGPGPRDVVANSVPITMQLPDADSELLLEVRVANFHIQTGGLSRAEFYLGPPRSLDNLDRQRLAIALFLIGAMMASGLYHLALFRLRRLDTSLLFFALICFIWVVRLLVIEDNLLLQVWPAHGFEWNMRIAFLTFTAAVPASCWYIRALFPGYLALLAARASSVFGLLASLFVLFTPARIFTVLQVPFEIVMAIVVIYVFYVIGRATLRRAPDTLVLIAGLVIYALTLLHDLAYNHGLSTIGPLAPAGIFLFLFSQAYLLSSRYASAFHRKEELSASLELLAADRNRDLQTALTELRAKDELLQQELDIAAEVQDGTRPEMPAHVGDTYVTAYSRSHGKVGGDFYDLLALGGDRAGVLIADVSGHGVPAALVANMARMSFRQEARRRISPRAILERVNTAMAKLIGTQEYLTAFLLVIAPDGKTHYSNAAHRNPAVIRKSGEIEYLRADGLLLGAFETQDNSYEEGRLRLERGDRVVLFTDGLLDLFMDADPDEWEQQFTRFLQERVDLSADELRAELIRHLAAGERRKLLMDDITFMIVERTG